MIIIIGGTALAVGSLIVFVAIRYGLRNEGQWDTPALVLCALVAITGGLVIAAGAEGIAERKHAHALLKTTATAENMFHARHGRYTSSIHNLETLSPQLATELRGWHESITLNTEGQSGTIVVEDKDTKVTSHLPVR
jgi:hypothetical protein